jgi:dephospho-CoA kinase
MIKIGLTGSMGMGKTTTGMQIKQLISCTLKEVKRLLL